MTIKELEQKLKTQLPEDYKTFIAPHDNETFKFFHGIEHWTFLSPEEILIETLELRKGDFIGNEDVAFALNYDDYERTEGEKPCALFYRKIGDIVSNKIFHLGLMRDQMFHAFSISEFELKDVTDLLKSGIKEVGFEHQNLDVIKNCPGSLYWYAHELELTAYEDETTLKRSVKALELFFEIVEKGHPRAANSIANHYQFQNDVDVEKVLFWMEKSIQFDSPDYIYEMANFIIDEKPSDIDKAIELLERLLNTYWYKARAALKLSRVYMRNVGGKLNYEKGIQYAEISAEAGDYNAFSDLGAFYYKGIGVPQDTKKAYEYMVKANDLSKSEPGEEGFWEEVVLKLKKEIEGS